MYSRVPNFVGVELNGVVGKIGADYILISNFLICFHTLRSLKKIIKNDVDLTE